jgi:thiol:disulfide interchange protein DsbA
MVKILRYGLGLLIALLPILVWGATVNPAASTFVEGKDYKIVQPMTAPVSPLPTDKVQVIEFFNYGCPACNHFEPALEKWLLTKPADVAFERVPVVFHPEWDILARAYYVAKDLGVADKMSPVIFKAIHQQGEDLSTPDALAKLFAQYGVKEQDFNNALHFSPGIDAQMMRGDNLMGVYQVFQIPTLIINGKYRTDLGMAGSAERMILIENYLIAKARQDMKLAA